MSSILNALFAAAAITSPMDALSASQLPETFVAACLDGSVRLAAGQTSPSSFSELPSRLRDSLQKPRSSQVWKLNSPGRAYLYIMDYEAKRGVSPKICGLASDEMQLSAGAKLLASRVGGDLPPDYSGMFEWMRPQDGYVAMAARKGKFKVLQITWLDSFQRRLMMQELRQLGVDLRPSQTAIGDRK